MCSYMLQPFSFTPLVDSDWPVRSLWPQCRPLLFPREMLLRNMREMRGSLDILEKLQQQILEEFDHVPSSSSSLEPLKYHLEKEGESFALTLDTKDFSPEELCVKQLGRKLRVSGKSEKKQEDGKGSYCYRRQEFRREFELPEDVNPEAVSCSFADGRLRIRAPREALRAAAERVLPIDTTSPDVSSARSQRPVNKVKRVPPLCNIYIP
uniref:SHSP domain-containing protein n=1 Tax=Scleropages formosus TaxID=113540 RepID=A0A8D0CJ88_SCLFO